MYSEVHKPKTYEWLYNRLFFLFLFALMCYFLKSYCIYLFGDASIFLRQWLIKLLNGLKNATGYEFFKRITTSLERKNTLSMSVKKKLKSKERSSMTKSLRVKNTEETTDFFTDLGENVDLLEQAFRMFDKDGSGIISRAEFRNVVRSLGHNPSEEQINLLMAKVDVDGNGMVDCIELLNFMKRHFGVWDPKGDLLPVFQMLAEQDPNESINSLNSKKSMQSKSSKSNSSSSSEGIFNGIVRGTVVKELISTYHSPDFDGEELAELLGSFDDDELYDFDKFVEIISGPESAESYDYEKFVLDSSLSYSPGI